MTIRTTAILPLPIKIKIKKGKGFVDKIEFRHRNRSLLGERDFVWFLLNHYDIMKLANQTEYFII